MRRPWHIWFVYVLCLAIVLPALGWLTHQTLLADRADFEARLAAEREEVVGSILWQMDTQLTTLLAQEAARPHFVYSPFYAAPAVISPASKTPAAPEGPPGEKRTTDWPAQPQLPSPLLMQPSPYVLLHFQVNPDGSVTSPQAPLGKQLALAESNGASPANIDLSNRRLNTLQTGLPYDKLVALLPPERLPEIGVGQWQLSNNDFQSANNESQIVRNSLNASQLEQANSGLEPAVAPNSPAQQQAAVPFIGQQAFNQRSQQRAAFELQQRNNAYQNAAQKQLVEQRLNFNSTAQLKYVREGVSQPIWLDRRLVLARRVNIGDEEVVQGCWLDWPKIRDEMVARYGQLLPGIRLEPVTPATDPAQVKVGRLLATLPAQIVLPDLPLPAQPWSPLRAALVVAWVMLALAALAVALLLQGVITLSERRGAFVSAVTHELRTPLTTFRMYAEMLAENMVPNTQTRQRYLETLRIEADRLSHLVENVLSYARLERGRRERRREMTTLGKIVEHGRRRFAERAEQAEMEFVLEAVGDAAAVSLETDPAAIEQILFNLIDNACKYAVGANDRRIHLELSATNRQAVFRVRDHGPGIDAKAARRLFQPFSKSVHDAACSAPGVGLGLALSRRLARELGGRLELAQDAAAGALFALYLPR
jgi:signal transduction histidine kinase